MSAGSPIEGRLGLFMMADSLHTGGTERQFVTMAHALAGGIFQVHTACLSRAGAFLDQLPGIEEFSPGNNLFGLQSQRTRFALARRMRQLGVAVAHAFDFYANLMLIPAARMARVPVVIGSHRQLGDLMTSAKFSLQKQMFRLCDRVVCNSQAAADRLGLAQRKLTVIPNALPDAAFDDAAPSLPREPGKLRVGMVARMNDPVKNHRGFLQMAARVVRNLPNAEFVVAGDGPLRPEIEGLAAQLELTSRTKFLGDCRDVPAVLASVDVLVQPSLSESLSNVILEGMAAGLPVVAARVGGNPELIKDRETGMLTGLAEEELASAVSELLRSPELRKRIGSSARAEAQRKYRVSSVRQQYEDLYQSLLPSKAGAQEARKLANLA
ncbi:MAG TPA: glycosyltransferase family 4 protein [Terriglobales bacterium]|nr:glycosyltransferase family 4 protein [Terriglobales bacterium]